VRRSLIEYIRELGRGYWSLVVGIVFGALGGAGIFWSDHQTIQIIAVVGMVVGLLVAPLQAFHRMRVQRDIALGQDPLRHLRGPRLANPLSAGNWGLDSFGATTDDGIAARAIVAAGHRVRQAVELETDLAHRVEQTLQNSALESLLRERFDPGRRGSWDLVTPTNDWIVTVRRDPVPVTDDWEMYMRCIVQLPRSFSGVWPIVLTDVFFRPVRPEPVPDAQFNPTLSPVPIGRARLDLPGVSDILHGLGATVVDQLAQLVFPEIVKQTRRERLVALIALHLGLRLFGPNFELRSKPHPLTRVLELPDAERRPGAPEDTHLFIETPEGSDAFNRNSRDDLISRGIRRFLRQHEYVEVDAIMLALATT